MRRTGILVQHHRYCWATTCSPKAARMARFACSVARPSQAPLPTRATSRRSLPRRVARICSPSRRYGNTPARPGCLPPTTAAPRPGNWKVASSSQRGQTTPAAPVPLKRAACCLCTRARGDWTCTRQLRADSSPNCLAVRDIGTAPSCCKARSSFPRAMPTITPPAACWISGVCPAADSPLSWPDPHDRVELDTANFSEPPAGTDQGGSDSESKTFAAATGARTAATAVAQRVRACGAAMSLRPGLARIALGKLHAFGFGIQSLQHFDDQATLHFAGLLGIDQVPYRRIQPGIRVDAEVHRRS